MEEPLSEEMFESGREDLLQRCRDIIAVLNQELEGEKAMRMHAEALNNELQHEVSDLQDKLHSVKVADYSRLLETEQNDVAYDHARKQLTVYKDQLTRCLQDQTGLQSQNEDLKSELQKAKRLLEEAREELGRSKAAVTEWSSALSGVEGKLKTLTKENKSLKDTISSQTHETESSKAIYHDQISRLQSQLAAYEDKLATLRSQLKSEEENRRITQEKYMENYKKQTEEQQEARTEMMKGQLALERELDEAKKDIYRLKEKISSCEDAFEAARSHVASLEEEKGRLIEEIEDLKGEVQAKEQGSERLRGDLERFRAEAVGLREQVDGWQRKVQTLEYKNLQLEQGWDKTKKELTGTIAERDEALQQSLRQKAEWEDKLRVAKEQHRKDVQNLLEENKYKLEAALRDYEAEFEKELNAREQDQASHLQELQSLQDACTQSLQDKEDQVTRLNQDRERLREAVLELESKLVLLSRTFEERTSTELRRERKSKARIAQENETLREQLTSLQSQLIQESELFKSETRRKDDEIIQIKRQAEERIARRTAAINEQSDLKVLEMKERCLKELALLSKLLTSVELEGRSGSGRLGDYLKGVIDRLEQGGDSQ